MAAAPQDLHAQLRAALTALRAGDARAARAACDRVLAVAPTQFDAWRMRALACAALDDADGQRVALQHAHAARPLDAACALDLGSVLLDTGDARAARPLLQQASDAPARDARATFRLGRACAALDDVDGACAAFAASTARDPAWTAAWINLAVMHQRAGDLDAAVAAAQSGIDSNAHDADAHRTLAALLSHRFDAPSLQRGLRHAHQSLALAPDHAGAHADAALLSRKTGDLAAARLHAERAVALAPDDPAHVQLLGETLLLARDAPAAVAAYATAHRRGLQDPALQRQHAIALLQAGEATAAVPMLEAVLAATPHDQRAIAHLGVALAQTGRCDEAIERLGLHRHVHALALPVPPAFASHQAFHAALARDIEHHSRQRWEPAGLAAHGAYLSGELRDDDTPAIRAFDTLLRDALDGFIARSRAAAVQVPHDLFLRTVPTDATRLHVWSTLAPAAGHIGTHIHEESWLSGAYYVRLPDAVRDDDPDHAGWIEFGRPFATLPPVPEPLLRTLRPREGTLLLFPSYLLHRTRPFAGPGTRISLSFDLAAA